MNLSVKKQFLFSLMMIVAVFAALEGIARLAYRPEGKSVYDEHREIITVLGLPQLNETMEFDRDLFWRLRPNLSGHRVKGRVNWTTIDFTLSTNGLGLRSPEPSRTKPKYRVLAIGDSCTFGLGVDDGKTWPAQLELLLDESLGGGAEVINAGVPGYTAFQGRRLLEQYGLVLEPDLIIATYGFNDPEVWSSRSDVETAKLLAARRFGSMLRASRLVLLMESLLARDAGPKAEFSPGEPDSDRRARLSPEDFRENLTAIHKAGADRGIPVVFLVWPYRNQVEEGRPEPVIYQPVIHQVGRAASALVIDLVGPFIESTAAGNALFLDHVHASPAGSRLAAKTIADLMDRARSSARIFGTRPDSP